ncbi:hypothetical protein LOAG_09290 [Loa loa]|uniref:Uncharacterized protein n=1 Tax=Loa loa TaxID=7209 RepID=A0A1S0TTS2_LOALO|nr:hypothetical protein LOAG_09290 [Loa loa]EFO19204.1 hypothetical protein LOAG_09290 [Loa loa]
MCQETKSLKSDFPLILMSSYLLHTMNWFRVELTRAGFWCNVYFERAKFLLHLSSDIPSNFAYLSWSKGLSGVKHDRCNRIPFHELRKEMDFAMSLVDEFKYPLLYSLFTVNE